MFTNQQLKLIVGLSQIARKEYNTKDLVDILKQCYPLELKSISDINLEMEIVKVLYNI